jgi:hypothetical protein
MSDFYINLQCYKCGRYVGKIVQGSLGQYVVVGCKECKISTNITLKDGGQSRVGELEISTGFYYPYDS